MENYKLQKLRVTYAKAAQHARELRKTAKQLRECGEDASADACEHDAALYEEAVQHSPTKDVGVHWVDDNIQSSILYQPIQTEPEKAERIPRPKKDLKYAESLLKKLMEKDELDPYLSVGDCLLVLTERDKQIEFLERVLVKSKHKLEEKEKYMSKYYGRIRKTAFKCLREIKDQEQLSLF